MFLKFVGRVTLFWEKFPPDRSEPKFYTTKEMARFIGNKFVPNSIQMLMLSVGVLIGSSISLKYGTLNIEQITGIM